MTFARQRLGERGEALAVRELERRGYEIIHRRYRCERGEIDIVARDGGTLVFVEVKAREDDEKGRAVEAVTPQKIRQIVRVAIDYLARHHIVDTQCRFDVVAIDHASAEAPEIAVFANAFEASA
jgi:putative endonuclease